MKRTPAQQAVIMQLSALLGKESPYRVGALLLTYDREDKDGCLSPPNPDGGVDAKRFIRCIRVIAPVMLDLILEAQDPGVV